MTALDDAVKAAMDEAGCDRATSLDHEVCRMHTACDSLGYPDDDYWATDRDECSVIGSAVRAGWVAAIDAAALEAHCEALRLREVYGAEGRVDRVARNQATGLDHFRRIHLADLHPEGDQP